MTDVKEIVIEGDDIDRVRFVGTGIYTSEKENYKNKKFHRFAVKGLTFRAHEELDAEFIKDIKSKSAVVRKIYLIPRKGVKIGTDSDGKDITVDVNDFDGYTTNDSATATAKVTNTIKLYSEGKVFNVATELADLEGLLKGEG